MKETPLTLFVVACATLVTAQALPTYTAQEASKHVGETAIITGQVEDVHQTGKENVVLTMAGKYPKQLFTVFIPATTAVKFPHPERGTVEKEGGKAQRKIGDVKKVFEQ